MLIVVYEMEKDGMNGEEKWLVSGSFPSFLLLNNINLHKTSKFLSMYMKTILNQFMTYSDPFIWGHIFRKFSSTCLNCMKSSHILKFIQHVYFNKSGSMRTGYCFVLLFWPCCLACGILVPWSGIESGPQQWTHWLLATGLPGCSLTTILNSAFSHLFLIWTILHWREVNYY